MNFAMREHCTFTTKFLNVAKFTVLIPLSLLISCKLSFPVIYMEIFSMPTFALKSPNSIFMYLGN
jgi:hypothetical protein